MILSHAKQIIAPCKIRTSAIHGGRARRREKLKFNYKAITSNCAEPFLSRSISLIMFLNFFICFSFAS